MSDTRLHPSLQQGRVQRTLLGQLKEKMGLDQSVVSLFDLMKLITVLWFKGILILRKCILRYLEIKAMPYKAFIETVWKETMCACMDVLECAST